MCVHMRSQSRILCEARFSLAGYETSQPRRGKTFVEGMV